jgi:excisionase family DNA binding protein
MAKRHDRRRVKIHINYDITEVADLLGVHKHTVRRWIAAGLPTTDDKRPLLIHGAELLAFLKTREPAKQRCKPGEFFCLGCKSPKRAAGDMADYVPRSARLGSLYGFCPTCGTEMYRAVNVSAIGQLSAVLDITFPKAKPRLDDTSSPLSNVDFRKDKKR